MGIEYVSFRENIDTGGPLGRVLIVIIGAIAELERNLIIERVRAGMRRARLEGQHIGRNPLVLDHAAIVRDRQHGQSLRQVAKGHRISTATVQRVLRVLAPAAQQQAALQKGSENQPAEPNKTPTNTRPDLFDSAVSKGMGCETEDGTTVAQDGEQYS